MADKTKVSDVPAEDEEEVIDEDVPEEPEEEVEETEDEPKKKKGKVEVKKAVKKAKKEPADHAKPIKAEKKGKEKTEAPAKKSAGDSPFRQPESLIYQAFEMCRKGVTIAVLTAFVKKNHGEPTRILRIMKSGNTYGKKWVVNENKGHIKIKYPA